MSSEPHGSQQTDTRARVEALAGELGELLEIELGPDEIVGAILQVPQIEHNKSVLLKFQREVFNAADWSTENLQRHLHPEFIDHAAMEGDPPGIEGVQMRFSGWAGAFSDPFEDNLSIVGQGDMLAVLYNLHATHSGAFMGVGPTDSPVVIPGIEFVRIKDDMIAEHWGIYDFLMTAEELGVDLAFLPREAPREPRQPVAPWAVRMTEANAEGVGEDAERYLHPDE